MARVVSYPAGDAISSGDKVIPPGTSAETGSSYRPKLGEHGYPHVYAWLDGDMQSHMSTGLGTIQRGRDNLNVAWELGWERVEHREYEIDATYARYFNPRWSAFAGYRLTNMIDGHDAGIIGATYRLPYLLDLTPSLQTNGDARLALGKRLQLTTRLGLVARAEYDTAQDFSWMAGLSYTLNKRFSLVASHDSDYGFGAGAGFRF